MSLKRVEIKVDRKIIFDLIFENENKDYVFIEKDVIYSDLEKGYEELEFIIERISDNRFFKGIYYRSSDDTWFDHNFDLKEISLEEVFPKKKTIIVYE